MRYFCVTCKHGHHGNNRYQPITFVFGATDAIRAMDLAKQMPGVKHGSMILGCREIPYSEYIEYRKISAYRRLEDI